MVHYWDKALVPITGVYLLFCYCLAVLKFVIATFHVTCMIPYVPMLINPLFLRQQTNADWNSVSDIVMCLFICLSGFFVAL